MAAAPLTSHAQGGHDGRALQLQQRALVRSTLALPAACQVVCACMCLSRQAPKPGRCMQSGVVCSVVVPLAGILVPAPCSRGPRRSTASRPRGRLLPLLHCASCACMRCSLGRQQGLAIALQPAPAGM